MPPHKGWRKIIRVLPIKWAIATIVVFAAIAVVFSQLAFTAMPSSAAVEPPPQAEQPAVRINHCHTVTPATYNRHVRKLDRLERLNPDDLDNQRHKLTSKKKCKHRGDFPRLKAMIYNACRPRHVVTGRTSVFSGGKTASGEIASKTPGLAININPGTDSGWNNAKVRGWLTRHAVMRVTLLGRTHITRLVDLGPAGWVNRAIDFTAPLARLMGFSVSAFPTDSVGSVYRYLYGCR